MNEAQEKEMLLGRIHDLAMRGAVTRQEVEMAYYKGAGDRQAKHDAAGLGSFGRKTTLADVLCYVGGAIIFLGIVILVRENWDTLSMPLKIAVTLGSGILAYIVGLLFDKDARTRVVSPAMYLIFSLVTPVGLAVVFNNAGYDFSMAPVQSLVSAVMCLVCLISAYAFQKKDSSSMTVFSLFSILFGTWLFFAFTNFLMMSGMPAAFSFDSQAFFEYRLLATGLVYCILGYSFAAGSDMSDMAGTAGLSGFLYGSGILMFLGSALVLGGWTPGGNPFWDIAFPFLVFGVLFLSVRLRSKSFLTFGSIFLMAYILKITSEYFSQDIGWPLALVIAGLLLMAVGWMSFYLNKKYIK